MTRQRLGELAERGWVLTRDGSTATAYRAWEDPDDPDTGWELLVLHTAGHGARFSLSPLESGLTERAREDLLRLQEALAQARELLETWAGELPEDT